MPGATTARLVVCALEMPMKLFMMPQTVPNRPMNGAVAPMVASTPVPRDMVRAAAASMRSSRHTMRDRKSTRLNSSHLGISYAVFCLKNKNKRSSPYNQMPDHFPNCISNKATQLDLSAISQIQTSRHFSCEEQGFISDEAKDSKHIKR